MKVLQKIARFVSVLFGILIHRYRKAPHWCASCAHNNANHEEHNSPCYRCIAQKRLGRYSGTPSAFTINSREKKKED